MCTFQAYFQVPETVEACSGARHSHLSWELWVLLQGQFCLWLTSSVRFSYCVTYSFPGHYRMCAALINPASVIHGLFHAGSGCCLQCTLSLSLGQT